MSALPWPRFWSHVEENYRQPLRDALSELLRHGVILGDEGSGRDLYRLVRDQFPDEIAEYFAPLGLRIVTLLDPPLIQAQPIPEECDLVAQFTQQETLLALVLWRIYDEGLITGRSKTILISANDLWQKWRVIFDNIHPPSMSAVKDSLARLRRKRLVRYTDAQDPAQPGDATIEILPTLPRVVDFSGLEEWHARAVAFQNENATPSEDSQTQ